MVDDSIKLVAVQYLNLLFGSGDENQLQFFDGLNDVVYKQYYQHSFGEEYVK